MLHVPEQHLKEDVPESKNAVDDQVDLYELRHVGGCTFCRPIGSGGWGTVWRRRGCEATSGVKELIVALRSALHASMV
jgi:hypothetical protein